MRKQKTKAKVANGAGRDEFGLLKGSKSSAAAAMFAKEGGATMAQVSEKIGGGTVYNMLKRLAEAGHRVKKDGRTIFLTAKKRPS